MRRCSSGGERPPFCGLVGDAVDQGGDVAGHQHHTTACLCAICSVTSACLTVGRPLPAASSSRRNRCTRIGVSFARWMRPTPGTRWTHGDLVLGLGGGGAVADRDGVADPLLEEGLDGHPSGAGDALLAFGEEACRRAGRLQPTVYDDGWIVVRDDGWQICPTRSTATWPLAVVPTCVLQGTRHQSRGLRVGYGSCAQRRQMV